MAMIRFSASFSFTSANMWLIWDGGRILIIFALNPNLRWLGSRVVSVLDSGTKGPGFKSQSRHCLVTVLGKLFTPNVPLFIKQQNW